MRWPQHPSSPPAALPADGKWPLHSRWARRGCGPARQLRSAWTDAWEDPANPKPLPMPLHSLLTMDAQQSIQQDARRGGEGGKKLINYFVGQSVGMLNQVRPAAAVYQSIKEECEAVLKRMGQLANG